MASLTADEIFSLVQAASDAAQAASSAAQALRDAQTSRASNSRFHEASKVVRQPDPFGSEVHDTDLNNWQDFSTNFKAWLFYANSKYEEDFLRIEITHADQPIVSVDGEAEDLRGRCHELYSVLTGLLRGKPLRMLRQVENRNGYEVWRQLSQLFQPRTKARAISTLSALMNIPTFVQKDRTLLDQILGLERLRTEYCRASGTDIADDIMLSVLVRALPKAIQQHVQLQMSETSTYAQIRSLVVAYEKTTTSWSPAKIHTELGILPSSANSGVPSSYSGSAPMEIDRFEKGKSKGKSKGKNKGKDTQKGKGKSKSDKGKGKGGKSAPRTATANDQCLHCGKYGHFKRDCWSLHGKPADKKVNQVSGGDQQPQHVPSTSTSSTTGSSTISSMPPSASVRLVTCPEPYIEELSSDASDLEFHDLTLIDSSDGFVNMVSQPDFALDTTDLSASSAYMECVERFDLAYSDFDDSWTYCDGHCISTDDQSNMSNNLHCDDSSPSCIRAFGFSEPKSVEVVLDSGADGSVLPLEFGSVGLPDKDFDGSKYIDAQGKPISISGARIAEVRFGPVVFRERFIIAPVTSPLISMGRLLKDGWHLQNNGDGTMELVRKQRHIPVHFKRNSLCATGVIRMLSENNEITSPSSPSSGQVDTAEHVRALTLGRALTGLGRGWIKLSDHVYALRSTSPNHVDTTYCPSEGLLWLRTTLIRCDDDEWELEEFGQSISDLQTMVGPFNTEKRVVESITIAHTAMVPPESLGFSVSDDAIVAPRSGIPLRQMPPAAAAAEAASVDDVPAAEDAELAVADRPEGVETTEVWVDGVKLDFKSPLRTLRSACESLGLVKSGGKKVLLERLGNHLQTQEMLAAHAAQHQLQGEMSRPVYSQPVPDEPTAEEVDRHRLTHHPFAPWCELCVAHRAVQDAHREQEHTTSSHSCVSFDFGFASRLDGEETSCALYIHDRDTGAMHVIPTPAKGGKYLNYLCTEFCRFLIWIGHTTVALKCDQEPSTLSVLEAVKKTCRALGIRTLTETVPAGSHASNGAAEVTVKVIRQYANLLIDQLEKGCGLGQTIGCHHPLYHWALLHSAWVHNRFVVRRGQTAYELCADRVYTGRLALFGESVLGFLKRSTKGSPQWTRGVWLGKTLSNDVHILALPGSPQLFVTRSVRRFPKPWRMEDIGAVEACPWSFGYASLGSQLVLAKRVAAPPVLSLPEVKPRDLDAEAVMNLPPTPVEVEDGPHPSRPPAVAAPPVLGVATPAIGEPDVTMEMPAEAGIPHSVGLDVPRTPIEISSSLPSTTTAVDTSVASGSTSGVHGREPTDEATEASRPMKYPRIMAVFEHEDDTHALHFEDAEVDNLEMYEYECDEKDDEGASPELATSDVLKRLCVPYSTFEPELEPAKLLELDLLADELEISRLKSMGVLLPVDSVDTNGQVPKKLTTRMVRAWRDKHIDGQHVWLRRSRYVAREYAWLSPERQDLFSPASSVLTVRLLPCLYMKWKVEDYVLCSIDITDAFLMVDQQELTQVVCEDAGGNVSQYLLGKVLPGQRNGSQMWHESFSAFLREDLKIEECEPYPCLLRTELSANAEKPACLLLLHVDDVLCLSQRNYLETVLLPALKARYKISSDVMSEEGDELTFLKRRHVLLSPNELAIQSHPKHLEKLFELLKIGRGLRPKKTPVHPLLDEDDKSELLDAEQASIYRSCIGILLYISSDYIECQYAIRGLSQSMSRPTRQSMECLRYLCTYLLGCTDQCIVLKYESHQGLLHYNPEDFTLEIYSDSDWAKHRTTRRSVSSGYLFLFGNLLYSSSRSQKALALSSCEAEVYAGTSATCDGILLKHCICFCAPSESVKLKLALDNAAGRSFFHRSGVGRIRHISLRVLWMQKQVRDKLLAVGPVNTKHNPSDLGTKRLSRDRMLYLLFLCKAYDLGISEYVGSEVAEREKQAEITKQGIKVFRLAGMGNHDAKTLMRVMLLSALSLPVTASPLRVPCAMTWDSMAWTFLITLLCIAIGYIGFLHYKLNDLSSDERRRSMWNVTLTKVMKLLVDYKKKVIAETGVEMEGDGEEEKMTEDDSAEESDESPASKRRRYLNAPMEECSDDEFWRFCHHGVPAPEDPPRDHRSFSDQCIEQLMADTNSLLQRRIRRLRGEYNQACEENDQDAMDHLWGLICECEGLMYGRNW